MTKNQTTKHAPATPLPWKWCQGLQRAPLDAAYEAERDTLYAAYEAQRAPLDAAYEAKCAPLYAAYKAKCATLDAAYKAERDTLDAYPELVERAKLLCGFVDAIKDCIPDWRERMKISGEGYTSNVRVILRELGELP